MKFKKIVHSRNTAAHFFLVNIPPVCLTSYNTTEWRGGVQHSLHGEQHSGRTAQTRSHHRQNGSTLLPALISCMIESHSNKSEFSLEFCALRSKNASSIHFPSTALYLHKTLFSSLFTGYVGEAGHESIISFFWSAWLMSVLGEIASQAF